MKFSQLIIRVWNTNLSCCGIFI